MKWIDEAMDTYFKFLKDRIRKTDLDDGWISITTPFYNMYNDGIEIYCCNDNGKIILSDDGETLDNLELSGVSISRSKTRREMIQRILINYNVTLNKDSELIVTTDMKGFAQAKHNLLCAIIEISDMYILAKPNAPSMFKDNVANYLDEQNVIFTPSFIAKGKTGLEFNFAFQIAGRETELLINTFNVINTTNLAAFLFDWRDIKEGRSKVSHKETKGLAIINDIDKKIDSKYLDAFATKDTEVILYSKRNTPDNVKKLKVA